MQEFDISLLGMHHFFVSDGIINTNDDFFGKDSCTMRFRQQLRNKLNDFLEPFGTSLEKIGEELQIENLIPKNEEGKRYKFGIPVFLLNIVCLFLASLISFHLYLTTSEFRSFVRMASYHIERNDFDMETHREFVVGNIRYSLMESHNADEIESAVEKSIYKRKKGFEKSEIQLISATNVEEEAINAKEATKIIFHKTLFEGDVIRPMVEHKFTVGETYPKDMTLFGKKVGKIAVIYFAVTLIEIFYFCYFGVNPQRLAFLILMMRFVLFIFSGFTMSPELNHWIPLERQMFLYACVYTFFMCITYDQIAYKYREVKEKEKEKEGDRQKKKDFEIEE